MTETKVTPINDSARELAIQVDTMVEEWGNFEIASNEQLIDAAGQLKTIKGMSKSLTTERKAQTVHLDRAKKAIMDWFKRPLDKLFTAEQKIKKALLVFEQAEEQKRQEAQRKLEAQAKKEEEKKKKQLEARAKKQEEKGNIEKADELREKKEDVYVPAPIIEKQTPKIAGLSIKKIWKYRIVDVAAILRKYLIPNDKMLGELARATKGVLDLPGIEFYAEDNASSRSN